jgi:anti-anti-sigma factor
MDIEVTSRSDDPVTVVALRGALDVDSCAELPTVLTKLTARGAVRIVVDLGGLTFCDSIGLSALVDAHRHCHQAGGYLRLAAATPFLLRTLAVVGLLRRLPVYPTVQAARADDRRQRPTSATIIDTPPRP